jgi:hypothetical protein
MIRGLACARFVRSPVPVPVQLRTVQRLTLGSCATSPRATTVKTSLLLRGLRCDSSGLLRGAVRVEAAEKFRVPCRINEQRRTTNVGRPCSNYIASGFRLDGAVSQRHARFSPYQVRLAHSQSRDKLHATATAKKTKRRTLPLTTSTGTSSSGDVADARINLTEPEKRLFDLLLSFTTTECMPVGLRLRG